MSTPTFLTEDTADDTEEVPEEISNRILRRILIFAGLPTFSGILSLPLFYYLKVQLLLVLGRKARLMKIRKHACHTEEPQTACLIVEASC